MGVAKKIIGQTWLSKNLIQLFFFLQLLLLMFKEFLPCFQHIFSCNSGSDAKFLISDNLSWTTPVLEWPSNGFLIGFHVLVIARWGKTRIYFSCSTCSTPHTTQKLWSCLQTDAASKMAHSPFITPIYLCIKSDLIIDSLTCL